MCARTRACVYVCIYIYTTLFSYFIKKLKNITKKLFHNHNYNYINYNIKYNYDFVILLIFLNE